MTRLSKKMDGQNKKAPSGALKIFLFIIPA
jgi:hypothetical protein